MAVTKQRAIAMKQPVTHKIQQYILQAFSPVSMEDYHKDRGYRLNREEDLRAVEGPCLKFESQSVK